MKKRIGKDFDAVISVQHDGEPINFSQYEVLWISIDTAYRRTKLKPGTWTTAGGLITAHIPRNLISSAGEHWFTVAYRKPDASIEDGYYDFEDNSESFQIVGKTEDEDAGDLTAKVELLAGLIGKAFKYEDFTPEQLESLKVKGDPFRYEDFTPEQLESLKVKGDPFTYADFTQEQLSEIKRPIVESAERADLAIAEIKSDATAFLTNSENILSAQLADNDNKVNQKLLGVDSFVSEKTSEINEKINQTDTATQNANTTTQNANDAAILANLKAGQANDAATLANTKAGLADAAAINANTKAGLAEEAATNADNARLAIAKELAEKAEHGYLNNPKTLKEIEDKFDKGSLIADYVHTTNKAVIVTEIDYVTGTFTSENHGFLNNKQVVFATDMDLIYPISVLPTGITIREYYVVNATANTFQLSTSLNGSPIVISSKSTSDLSKFRIEERVSEVKVIIPESKNVLVRAKGRSNRGSNFLYITSNIGAISGANISSQPLYVFGSAGGTVYFDIEAEFEITNGFYYATLKYGVITNTNDTTNTFSEKNLYGYKDTPLTSINSITLDTSAIRNGTILKIYKLK